MSSRKSSLSEKTTDDIKFAIAMAAAQAVRVIVVTKKDRDNPIYLDKRTRRPIGGIELNKRLRKL